MHHFRGSLEAARCLSSMPTSSSRVMKLERRRGEDTRGSNLAIVSARVALVAMIIPVMNSTRAPRRASVLSIAVYAVFSCGAEGEEQEAIGGQAVEYTDRDNCGEPRRQHAHDYQRRPSLHVPAGRGRRWNRLADLRQEIGTGAASSGEKQDSNYQPFPGRRSDPTSCISSFARRPIGTAPHAPSSSC